jgi:tyrosine-protein kinase Etk/Wzc
MENEYNLSQFMDQLRKWKKELFRAILLIVLLSVGGSLLMPNYYKAETTFYAASPDLAKPIPIGDEEKEVRIYGDDRDLDRLFTIAMSHDLLFHLIDSFDLYEHYEIDKKNKKAKYKVQNQLLDNYLTIKTKYGALHLMVEDKDPELAAAMANAARDKVAELAQKIVKDSQLKLMENYNENLMIKQVQSDTLAKKMQRLKKSSDIFETWGQSGLYTEMLAYAIAEQEESRGKAEYYSKYPTYRDSVIKNLAIKQGANNKIARANSELDKYAPILSELKQMEQEQSRLHDQISLDKERLKQLNATYAVPFTALHVVEAADVPVEKSRPKRSIIVLLTTLCGIAIAFFAIFVIENMYIFKTKAD